MPFPDKCLILDRHPILDAIGFSMCGLFTVICSPFVICLYRYNRRILNNLSSMSSLTSRFQCYENVEVLRSFFPVFIICFGLYGGVGLTAIIVAAYLSFTNDLEAEKIQLLARVSTVIEFIFTLNKIWFFRVTNIRFYDPKTFITNSYLNYFDSILLSSIFLRGYIELVNICAMNPKVH